jgi:7-cyano-7-deazaguanine synthase
VRAVVLLSGGLDSTVTAAWARSVGDELYALTIAYGQRHGIEISQSRAVAKALGAREHTVLDVDLTPFGSSALTSAQSVPKDRTASDREHGIPATYVPARNTVFLGLGLAYAESRGASRIYIGANIVDYSGYPDCRPEFLRAFEAVARLGTKAGVEGVQFEIQAPLLQLSKREIIQQGLALGAPLHLTHSCYDPGTDGTACGRCDSCLIRREGFRAAGVQDPVRYAA